MRVRGEGEDQRARAHAVGVPGFREKDPKIEQSEARDSVTSMPSDVVWAAVAGGGITGLVGYLGNRLTTRTAQAQIAATRESERERIAADRERLLLEHDEVDRRVRRDAYLALLVALGRLDMYGTGFPVSEDTFESTVGEVNRTLAAARLAAPATVRDAIDELGVMLNDLDLADEPAHESFEQRYTRAWLRHREAYLSRERSLMATMR